jgi:transcriptional regulator with XRE-family HTH domain
MDKVFDQIRSAILKSGETRYRIAQETGIGQPQLSRLMSGECGLSVEALERLADFLGLEIIADIRTGAILMGLGILLAVFTMFRRLLAS